MSCPPSCPPSCARKSLGRERSGRHVVCLAWARLARLRRCPAGAGRGSRGSVPIARADVLLALLPKNGLRIRGPSLSSSRPDRVLPRRSGLGIGMRAQLPRQLDGSEKKATEALALCMEAFFHAGPTNPSAIWAWLASSGRFTAALGCQFRQSQRRGQRWARGAHGCRTPRIKRPDTHDGRCCPPASRRAAARGPASGTSGLAVLALGGPYRSCLVLQGQA